MRLGTAEPGLVIARVVPLIAQPFCPVWTYAYSVPKPSQRLQFHACVSASGKASCLKLGSPCKDAGEPQKHVANVNRAIHPKCVGYGRQYQTTSDSATMRSPDSSRSSGLQKCTPSFHLYPPNSPLASFSLHTVTCSAHVTCEPVRCPTWCTGSVRPGRHRGR